MKNHSGRPPKLNICIPHYIFLKSYRNTKNDCPLNPYIITIVHYFHTVFHNIDKFPISKISGGRYRPTSMEINFIKLKEIVINNSIINVC